MSKPNKFKYNGGVEFNDDFGFDAYETLFRGYDPTLGRFMQIDPLADFLPGVNPYQFAFNNPVFFNDPFGLTPECDTPECNRRNDRANRKAARINRTIGRKGSISQSRYLRLKTRIRKLRTLDDGSTTPSPSEGPTSNRTYQAEGTRTPVNIDPIGLPLLVRGFSAEFGKPEISLPSTQKEEPNPSIKSIFPTLNTNSEGNPYLDILGG